MQLQRQRSECVGWFACGAAGPGPAVRVCPGPAAGRLLAQLALSKRRRTGPTPGVRPRFRFYQEDRAEWREGLSWGGAAAVAPAAGTRQSGAASRLRVSVRFSL